MSKLQVTETHKWCRIFYEKEEVHFFTYGWINHLESAIRICYELAPECNSIGMRVPQTGFWCTCRGAKCPDQRWVPPGGLGRRTGTKLWWPLWQIPARVDLGARLAASAKDLAGKMTSFWWWSGEKYYDSSSIFTWYPQENYPLRPKRHQGWPIQVWIISDSCLAGLGVDMAQWREVTIFVSLRSIFPRNGNILPRLKCSQQKGLKFDRRID